MKVQKQKESIVANISKALNKSYSARYEFSYYTVVDYDGEDDDCSSAQDEVEKTYTHILRLETGGEIKEFKNGQSHISQPKYVPSRIKLPHTEAILDYCGIALAPKGVQKVFPKKPLELVLDFVEGVYEFRDPRDNDMRRLPDEKERKWLSDALSQYGLKEAKEDTD